MGQAVDKGIGQALSHQLFVIVVSLMIDVEHRLGDIAYAVPQQIDSHHGQGMLAASQHVVWIVILHAQILAETQRLCLKPCLLQFYQDKLFRAIRPTYTRTEIDAQHRH